MTTTTMCPPATASDYAAAILDARRDTHRAELAGDTAAARSAEQRSYRLDTRASAAGFGYRDGVDFARLDMQAAAETYGPDSPVALAYAALYPAA